jgi:hypothetical protein
LSDISKLLSKEYKQLSEKDLKVYKDLAINDKKR